MVARLAVSAADTRVSVSGSGRLQPADVTLCLTAPGQTEKPVLIMALFPYGPKGLQLRKTTNTLLENVHSLWPDLHTIYIRGEQRRHLQAVDIRAEQGMTYTGQ